MNQVNYSEMVQQKREIFRMNLRKRTREDIFGKKRVLQPQIKPKINTIIMERLLRLGEQQDIRLILQNIKRLNLSDLKECVKLLDFLQLLFDQLNGAITEFKEVCLNNDLMSIMSYCLSVHLEHLDTSLLLIYDDMVMRSTKLTQSVLSLLCNISYEYQNIHEYFDIPQFMGFIILILVNTPQTRIFSYVCQFLTNLVIDKNEQIIDHLKGADLVQKVVNRIFDLQCLASLEDLVQALQLIATITEDYIHYGSKEFAMVYPVLLRLHSFDGNNMQTYVQCLELSLKFLTNISTDIEVNQPRVYQLFNEIIDKQMVLWVCELIMNINATNIINQGYMFLLNLSQLPSAFCMNQLLEQQVLITIQFQINEDNYPQNYIYLLLANLISSQSIKDKIMSTGILSRVHSGFLKALDTHQPYVHEIVQCVINAVESANEKQLNKLIKLQLIDCLIIYITDVPAEQLELRNVQESLQLILQLFKIQPKKSKYSILLQCKQNHSFILKIQQLLNYVDDGCDLQDIVHQILDAIH